MITVLGKTFNSEEERKVSFQEELRKKLPELKQLDGFPIGEDEDIISLSDPPYYTACPNPWLNDFIKEWEQEKDNIPNRKDNFEQLEPYAADVSEGKNNPIYNAHSYHTKVPHPAIMRYILHYTQPGDIILDGFAGTGMTGVAAQMCGNPDPQFKFKLETEWRNSSKGQPAWGARKAILGDLSPIASFIAYNYNTPVNILEFEQEANRILDEVEKEYGWMYETNHNDSTKGKIIYVVWSSVLTCTNCAKEFNYWKQSVNLEKNIEADPFNCPYCDKQIYKEDSEKSFYSVYDNILDEVIRQQKSEPVLISYKVGKKRYQKSPDEEDLKIIEKIEKMSVSALIPKELILGKGYDWGDTWRAGYHEEIKYFHQFYTKRNLLILDNVLNKIFNISNNEKLRKSLLFWFTSSQTRLHKMNRYTAKHGRHVGPRSNTLYISSTPAEISPFYFMQEKLSDSMCLPGGKYKNILQNISANSSIIENNSIDYIFTDPPFGSNIMYSELNFLWESWLKVKTNSKKEAIENKHQSKGKLEYQNIMVDCFKEYYRVLKSGKWMTVEFSNTEAAIWNAIQNAIQKAGFVISSIFALNKGRGGLQAIIGPIAVNQDLILSCYKPSIKFLEKFESEKTNIKGIWDFIEEHLQHLPVHLSKENSTTSVVERNPKILYDRLISFYLMRDLQIPIDAREFQEGLKQRFSERDGMYFTAEQVAEYDQKKSEKPEFTQLSLIVTNENEGIAWLRAKISDKTMTYQELQPDWMQSITAVSKGHILPELMDILKENFIQETDGKWRVSDMNEQKDRDALRNKSLLKEFAKYVEEANKPKGKLKEVRVEALRAGFDFCRKEKDYVSLVKVAEKIPQTILLEDEFLLMYYDNAKDKV